MPTLLIGSGGAVSSAFTFDGRHGLALFAVGSHGAALNLEFAVASGGPAWFRLAHDVTSGDYALQPTSAGVCDAIRMVPTPWGRVTTPTATATTQVRSVTVLPVVVP